MADMIFSLERQVSDLNQQYNNAQNKRDVERMAVIMQELEQKTLQLRKFKAERTEQLKQQYLNMNNWTDSHIQII